ncbi:helix-turn-helix domain-containing protein [Amycolatopsis carbonis]|uniref:Helix-turn-helix domain-containing protein n=1 Tax=Amycolatopsis carbonis TaxID=715471 RepID=A0A9Y2IFT8_9PSEU|nr:helix-turn-helix domain-containing protein [Amycolatopsis sp. 2-15]WIX78679.1 helix-turn-helix domain-containing protein [Amycolatopsis sp. 2-15]
MSTAPTEHEPLLLRVEEAARLLSIGRTRVYDLVRSGALKSVKVFGARRIPRVSIDSYIATLMQESEAA